MIQVLSQKTIDEIAAGEVVERPSSVVKELVENAIDAHATAISVETKNGGIDLIRVTDNGSGIPKEEVPTAFLPHATSKIRSIDDLQTLSSLGFRGEALPSIAAVSEVEVFTKTKEDAVGTLFGIRGGSVVKTEEVGVPDGTTFFVRNLFYNTPARRHFLKTPVTEASYVGDLMEKIAFSHPEIAFKWTSEGRVRLDTPGNGNLKALLYSVYGRETASEVMELRKEEGYLKIEGYVGKPVLSRGNRNAELYFVNGRFVRNKVVEKAIEDAYQPFMMQHRYPFLVLYLTLEPSEFDVNVHPSKLEIRFRKEGQIYDELYLAVKDALTHKEFIPEDEEEKKTSKTAPEFPSPEPFETRYSEVVKNKAVHGNTVRETPSLRPFRPKEKEEQDPSDVFRQREDVNELAGKTIGIREVIDEKPIGSGEVVDEKPIGSGEVIDEKPESVPEKSDPATERFLTQLRKRSYRLVGQIFETYWIIEMEDAMYVMDQHAAHEKVLYERKMRDLRAKKPIAQYVTPPAVVTLSEREMAVLRENMEWLSGFGYEIRAFGGREVAVSAVPSDLFGLDVRSFFTEVIGSLEEHPERKRDPEMLLQKIATMSCKAAVKGNTRLSEKEAEALLDELLTLENPYACPHGRPTLIRTSKTELEKKFKRIVS